MKKLLTITPKFNLKNFLEIKIRNNTKKDFISIKICFSLIYSIKSVQGAKIIKQIGRYYELGGADFNLIANTSRLITIKLQKTKISSYNMSCGPEGLFIINKENILIKSYMNHLTFEKKIPQNYFKQNVKITKMPIIPEPNIAQFSNEFIYCKKNFFIKNKKLQKTINTLQKTCRSLKINFKSRKGLIINYQKKALEPDAYIIKIYPKQIIIFSSNYGGSFYALISLIHLISYYDKKLPLGLIKDKPMFSWRGMHLDCARQYYSTKQIKRLLEYMALFKLNRFHWHLTDNEAWRLDIKSFPKIARKSAYRGYRQIIPPVYGSGYNKYGGYYKTKDVKEIIKYAKGLNIEVMPEIDLPAHSWALIQVMPEIINHNFKKKFHDIGNYKNNTINPSLNRTWHFIENVFKEVSTIFPFYLIHIGVDERPKNSWEQDNSIKDFMKKNNINNFDKLQDYFVNRIINILKNYNKKTAAWNEAVLSNNTHSKIKKEIKILKDCLIFAWQKPSVINESLKRGYKTVICQGQTCYLDMAYNNSTQERGLCWASTIETRDIHKWQPLKNIETKHHSSVLGLQGHLWSETITNVNYLDQMINPRLAAISEVAWSSSNRRKWNDFRSALFQAIKITKKLGWRNHIF